MGRTLTVAVTTLVDSEKGICAIYIQMHPQNQKALEVPEYLRLLTWLWYMIYMIPHDTATGAAAKSLYRKHFANLTTESPEYPVANNSEHLLLYAKVLPAPVLQSLEMACYHWRRVSDRRRVPSGLRQQQYPGCSVSPIHPKQTQQVDRYFHNPQQQKIISFRV